jgi:uncharacterized protein
VQHSLAFGTSAAAAGRRWAAVVAALGALFFAAVCFAQVAVPELRSPVTDLTNTLTPSQVQALEQKLLAFEQRKGSQVAVLLVPTTQPEEIEQYSIRVVEAWKIGRRGVDDGVLLIVAKDDRAVRIEVGYGAEGALPDVIANRIIQQVIVPRFREGQFYEGIDAAVDRILAVLDGEPLPEPSQRTRPSGEGIGQIFPLLLMVVFVVSGILRRLLGGVGGAAATAGIAGLLVWLLTGIVVIAVGAAVIAFLFTLLGGGGGSSGWTGGRRRGGYYGGWGGGGFGGGFGGGLGGGGWSGGGGGFGGGGASGRW